MNNHKHDHSHSYMVLLPINLYPGDSLAYSTYKFDALAYHICNKKKLKPEPWLVTCWFYKGAIFGWTTIIIWWWLNPFLVS
jgi:hypothetical protein